jgi:hypothetical protein
MRKTRITILVITVLCFSAIPLGLVINGFATKTAIPNYEPMDFSLNGRDTTLNMEIKGSSDTGLRTSAAVGDYALWIWYDDVTGLWLAYYQLVAEGEHCQVWVMTDLNYPAGDPRNPVIVTKDQCEYMADQFDNYIYETEAAYFGVENFHDGSNAALPFGYYDETGRTAILISNIGDESYYDYTYPSYIAGFYWGDVFEYYCDRNVISIDAYDYAHRLGDEDNGWFLNDEKARPNLYESVVAHEFQHLLHDDIFPGDETYMNEACSLFAEPLCGYPVDYGQIEWFLATPDNSLIEWGDQGGINILADYGAAFLWAVYLEEHYGPNFMSQYVQAIGLPKSSIERINALLPGDEDFYSVFHDWRLANLLDGVVSDEEYNYETLELNELDTDIRVYEISKKKIPWTSSETFGKTYTHETIYAPKGYKTDVVELNPFSTDYVALTGITGENYILFNGDDLAKYSFDWDLEEGAWHTKKGDLMDILIAGEAYVDPLDPNPTLSITTAWEIEPYWDYGFVQISTNDGETWTSLENLYTTDLHVPACIGKAVDNLPGLTGYSGDLIDMDFDLSAYSGQNVLIGFRYVTDWGTHENGWYIYDASVCGASVALENVPKEADFLVTMIKTDSVNYEVIELPISDMDETGMYFDDIGNDEDFILVISSAMEYGTVDYKFRNMLPHMM